MLYICATPIGNLQDITLRAIEVLSQADIILCEDTRTSKVLLNAHGIKYNKLIALHEHNENEVTQQVIEWLSVGKTIVQISDAGTPAISDPGAGLCAKVLDAGFKVSPIPGACAYTTLLSVSGIMCSSLFYGFLPSTKSKRIKILSEWVSCNYAVCIYESPHRILDTLVDIIDCLGVERAIVMGRELTKQFETIKKLSANELLDFVKSDKNQQKGEFVILILPNNNDNKLSLSLSAECIKTVNLLIEYLPPKKVAQITSEIHQINKNQIYQYLIENK